LAAGLSAVVKLESAVHTLTDMPYLSLLELLIVTIFWSNGSSISKKYQLLFLGDNMKANN